MRNKGNIENIHPGVEVCIGFNIQMYRYIDFFYSEADAEREDPGSVVLPFLAVDKTGVTSVSPVDPPPLSPSSDVGFSSVADAVSVVTIDSVDAASSSGCDNGRVAFVDLSDDARIQCVHSVDQACRLCGFNCCYGCLKERDADQRDGTKWECGCATIVVDDDEDDRPGESLSRYPPEWTKRDSSTQRTIRMVPLVESSQEYTSLIVMLLERMEQGFAKRGLLRDYLARTPEVVEFNVTSVQRVENPVLYDSFGAQVEKWRLINGLRSESERMKGDDPTAIMFHGTPRSAAESICRMGFSRVWNTRHVYGAGTYFTDHPQLALRHHCPPDTATNERTLLVCKVIRGRQARTFGTTTVAPLGFDSGGDNDEAGKGWITVLFEDSHAIVVYVVTLQMAEEAEENTVRGGSAAVGSKRPLSPTGN